MRSKLSFRRPKANFDPIELESEKFFVCDNRELGMNQITLRSRSCIARSIELAIDWCRLEVLYHCLLVAYHSRPLRNIALLRPAICGL